MTVLSICSCFQMVSCVTVSSNNRYVACGAKDCVVYLYELETGKVRKKDFTHIILHQQKLDSEMINSSIFETFFYAFTRINSIWYKLAYFSISRRDK